MSAFKSEIQAQNKRGEWVPAIPMPYYLPFGVRRCGFKGCGKPFFGDKRYRAHYALIHILGLD